MEDFVATYQRLFARLRQSQLGLAVIVVVASILFALGLSSLVRLGDNGSSYVALFEGLQFTRHELAEMEAAFIKSELNSYRIDGNRVVVVGTDRSRYINALHEAKIMPERFRSHVSEAINSATPWVTPSQQSLRVKNAQELDMAMAVRSLPGIEDAIVRYDEVQETSFNAKKVLSASVQILCLPNTELNQTMVASIRNMVAGTRSDLRPENVTVADLNAGRVYPSASVDPQAAELQQQLATKEMLEHQWEAQFAAALKHIPGVDVVVTAPMPQWGSEDRDQARVESSTTDSSTSLRVLVNIPNSYYRNQVQKRRKQFAGTTKELLSQVRSETEDFVQTTVKQITSSSDVDAKNTSVVVQAIDETSPSTSLASSSLPTTWLQKHGPAMGAMAILVLGFFAFQMVQGQTKIARQTESSEPNLKIFQETELPSNVPTPVASSSPDSPDELDRLKQQLSEMVQQDPDAAAKLLTDWMSQAG
ncbi:MAG: hypothetical protein KDA87_05160 [Planctomycetales bacterium]|nr:hypothetical protein [Planctomycetales bacterium]